MSGDSSWDEFIAGFDRSEPVLERADEDPIFEELDVLYEERRRRSDNRWFDEKELDRLVAERRASKRRK